MTIYDNLDTPSLLIDLRQAEENIMAMQKRADELGVKLRPHTKTHKMPYFAKKQVEAGACGIAVAKIGEAEVMAEHGITDILIANEIVGLQKYQRLRRLHERITIRSGIDSCFQIDQIEQVFADSERPYEVLAELEVGENRSGVNTDEHGIIEDKAFHDKVAVGEKLEIIPSHICPTVNLYDEAVLVSEGEVLGTVPVLCRGKTK